MDPFVPHSNAIDITGALSQLALRASNWASQLPSPKLRLEALSSVSDSILDLRHQLFYALNEAALINRLPDEILMRIFSQLTDEDLLSVLHSCRRWCILADQTAGHSCDIKFFTNASVRERAPHLLEFFQTVPISLDITFDISSDTSCEPLGAILYEHMHHLRKLRLRIFFDYAHLDKGTSLLPLVHALGKPAPLLQSLDIYISPCYLHPAELYLPDHLFADSAPVLRYVKLDGITSRLRAYAALSATRILDLDQPEVHLVRILDFYPRLEQLRVDVETLVAGRRQINPHNLQILELPGTLGAADIVLNRLVLTRPLTVWMADVGDDVLDYVISNMPKGKIQRARFCMSARRARQGLILGYCTGVTWYLQLARTSHIMHGLVLSQEETMSNIVDFSIHDVQWPTCDMFSPPAVRLSRMELVLEAFTDNDDFDKRAVQEPALFYTGSPFVPRCPALKEICISTPAKLPALTVDVYDICAFMCGNLSFDSEPRLVLRNVRLYDPALGHGMQMLTACVSDITYCPGSVHDAPYIHRKSKLLWFYDLPSI